MTRPRRPLSPEERALWAHVARGVTPLHRDRAAEIEAALAAAAEEAARVRRTEPAAAPPNGAPRPGPAERPPSGPPLAPFERKMKLALRRGAAGVDAAVDLHGLRQAEAHDALAAFLRRSQAAGHRLVLVVTGRGGAAAEGYGDERGVLRRAVPHWLRLPAFRPLVLGFEEAGPRHGGAGALYVRLRRPQRLGPPGG